jgi:hypothetical protein
MSINTISVKLFLNAPMLISDHENKSQCRILPVTRELHGWISLLYKQGSNPLFVMSLST